MGLDMTMNRLPAPTWNWLHVNEASLSGVCAPDEGHMDAETPETIRYHVVNPGCVAVNDGTSVNDLSSNVDADKAADADVGLTPTNMAVKLAQIPGGVGPDMEELRKQGNFDFHLWEIAPGVKESEPVRLHFRCENGEAVLNTVGVYAREDSEITVVMDFRAACGTKTGSEVMENGRSGQPAENVESKAGAVEQENNCKDSCTAQTNGIAVSEEDTSRDSVKETGKSVKVMAVGGSLAAIQTRILAEKGAKVTLVQIQNLEDGFTFINDVGASCAEGAKLDSIQLVLGGQDTYLGFRTDLGARSAALDGKIGYLLDNDEKLDLNYLAYQTGAKTTSHMDVSGVLRGASQKLFRGTIDFRKGSEGAKGDEKEDVLLFSDGVVNRTVPLILCEEEDVEGNHGATIGRLDDSLMFYLSSRGIEEKEIYEMMARARIDAVCSSISDERTREMVQEILG